MKHFPEPYDTLAGVLQRGSHAFDVRVRLGTYFDPATNPERWYDESKIIKLTTTENAFGASNPCIGAATSRSISLDVFVGYYIGPPSPPGPGEVLSYTGEIWIATRIIDTTDPTNSTGFLVEGPWIESKRTYDPMTGVLSVSGYDLIAMSDTEYMRIPEGSIGFCRSCFTGTTETEHASDVIADIAKLLGLHGVSTRTYDQITAAGDPMISRPDDTTTMRDIIRWIAGACGANARHASSNFTVGLLDFVPFNAAGELIEVGGAVGQLRVGVTSPASSYWDVCFEGADEDILSSHQFGDVVTTRFQLAFPDGTQAIADHALSVIRATGEGSTGWHYVGFQARDAVLDIRAECGDRIYIEYPGFDGVTAGFTATIGEITRTYDRACLATVSAPDLARATGEVLYITEE